MEIQEMGKPWARFLAPCGARKPSIVEVGCSLLARACYKMSGSALSPASDGALPHHSKQPIFITPNIESVRTPRTNQTVPYGTALWGGAVPGTPYLFSVSRPEVAKKA